jgi:hypothetical protein
MRLPQREEKPGVIGVKFNQPLQFFDRKGHGLIIREDGGRPADGTVPRTTVRPIGITESRIFC